MKKSFSFFFLTCLLALILFAGLNRDTFAQDYTVRFNGTTQNINCGSLPITGTTPRTIEAWIYVRFFNNGGIWQSGSPTAHGDFSLRTYWSAENVQDIWILNLWGEDIYVNLPNTADAWNHIAVVYDGINNIKIYSNGNLAANETRDINTTSSDFILGQWQGNPFNGMIDELRIWNTTRTQEQIKEGMVTVLSGPQSNLVAYYKFNEGGGTTINDYSGNSHTGTINTAINWENGVSYPLAAPPAGSGTQADPFRIYHLNNLRWLAESGWLNAWYVQTKNINAAATHMWPNGGWLPIAAGSPFAGNYNGQGYTIDGLYINRSGSICQGFICYTSGANISNLGLTNVNITGGNRTGALVGSLNGNITACYSTGEIHCIGTCGGLIGDISSGSIVEYCYSSCNVYANNLSGGSNAAGGLVGSANYYTSSIPMIQYSHSTGNVSGSYSVGGLVGNTDNCNIRYCYSTGNVNGSNDYVGGLVGNLQGRLTHDCYSTGNVNGLNYVGGLVGYLTGNPDAITIQNSYSIGHVTGSSDIGGLVGKKLYAQNIVSGCYWDVNSSGLSYSAGGTGKTIADMKSFYTYSGWDFTDVWGINETSLQNNGYPFNRAQQSYSHLVKPLVSTQTVTDVLTTTATGNGTISNLGNSNISQHGVCWSTAQNPSIALSTKTEQGAKTETGAFTSSISGLTANTIYYIRTYATNDAGTNYGEQVQFTTLASPPVVTTQQVTNITTSNATGNGTITDLGVPNPTQYGVCWSTTPNPTTSNHKTTLGAASTTGAFTSSITGLSPNTTYYLKAYASNITGTVYGEQVQFTTLPVLNYGLSFNGVNQYLDCGNVVVTGANARTIEAWVYTRSFNWGGVWQMGVQNNLNEFSIRTSNSDNQWIIQLWTEDIGVTLPGSKNAWVHLALIYDGSNVKLYYNGNLVVNEPRTLNTLANNFCVGKWGGNFFDGKVDEVRVWSTVRTQEQIANNMSSALTGSESNLLAYYKMNEGGGNTVDDDSPNSYIGTLYNAPTWIVFGLPLISTQSVTTISVTTAIGNGTITSLGETNPTQHGVCWSTSGNPSIDNSHTSEGPKSTTGTFTSNMTALIPGITYYVRAYATNTQGTAYGGQVQFTTLPAIPVVTTQTVTNISLATALGNGTITSLGVTNPTQHGVCWGTTENPTTNNNHTELGPKEITGVFTSNITGLNSSTTYYVRAYATNSSGTAYGTQVQFTTISETAGTALLFIPMNGTKVIGSPTVPISGPYTIEAWIKPNNMGNRGIVGWGLDGYTGACNVFSLSNNGIINYWCGDDLSATTSNLSGAWHHITTSYNGTTRSIYLDGNLVISDNPGSYYTYSNSNFGIGVTRGGQFFYGVIDEVRIYNSCKSLENIRRDMHCTKLNPDAGLISLWNFNEGTGIIANNLIGNGNGTLTNFHFDGTDGWVTSTAPLGAGTSNSSVPFTSGTIALGNVTIVTTDAFDNEVDLVCTQISAEPNLLPSGFSSITGEEYFILKAYGTPGTFAANLTFTLGAGVLDARADAYPGGVKLYRRDSNSDGEWSLVGGAASANSSTGIVTFNNITQFSQFVLVEDESALPVEFSSFTASAEDNKVTLKWKTETEVENYGFEIERSRKSEIRSQNSEVGNVEWDKVGFVEGAGNSNSPKEYSFIDEKIKDNGKYSYRLKQIDTDGSFKYSDELEVEVKLIPTEFALKQNYPNPFNPVTVISWQLPVSSNVTLKIYDILGNEVALLVNEKEAAGKYKVEFNGSSLSSGIYYYQLRCESFVDTKKFVLLK